MVIETISQCPPQKNNGVLLERLGGIRMVKKISGYIKINSTRGNVGSVEKFIKIVKE